MDPFAVTTTRAINFVYLYIFSFCIFLLISITVTMIFFVLKYNVKKHPIPEPSPDSVAWLEATWIIVPVLISLSMFYFGWKGFATLREAPPGAMVVQVTGRQWVWSFQYPNGKTSDKLYAPINRPVKLEITSKDVIHSFFVPAFRIKRDAVPGMTTHEWFQARREGSSDVFCAQYCGLGHSMMITKVVIMPEDKFQEWYQGKPTESAAAEKPSKEAERVVEGKKLAAQEGCHACHSTDGSRGIGPTWNGLYGSEITLVTDGKERTVKADTQYIVNCIEHPDVEIVKGFQPIMPHFPNLTKEQVEDLVDYIKSLK
jgi:cytochrome c oxidase subunit 2